MTEEQIIAVMVEYIKNHDVPMLIELVIKAIKKTGGKK